jgi:oligoribonuclease NrnB/cAMP/cGMP phosphodiesterase (DHH superfamily)
MDGHCAGAIVYRYWRSCESDGFGEEYIEIDFKDNFPFEKIHPNEKVVVVDFTLQEPGDWETLFLTTENIIWIDHHKTAIERSLQIPEVGDLEGKRVEGGKAGCELAWEYFFPTVSVPMIVQLLGDYDTWSFKFGDLTRLVQEGIKLEKTSPTHSNWDKWLSADEEIPRLQENGQIAIRYRDNRYAKLIRAFSYPVVFEGHRCIACNVGATSSNLFDSVEDLDMYDIMMPFVFDGSRWTVSLYTTKDIDVSEIAKKYGGGGHQKAAGFVCDELPFAKQV